MVITIMHNIIITKWKLKKYSVVVEVLLVYRFYVTNVSVCQRDLFYTDIVAHSISTKIKK